MRDVRRQPAMVVVINGSFGIGKTTVAKLLSSQRDRARYSIPSRWAWPLPASPDWFRSSIKWMTFRISCCGDARRFDRSAH
jgi:hypothetical protein